MDEQLIMAIVSNPDDDLKYKKHQIELYFSVHPDEDERAEYLKSAYPDRYTELIVDGLTDLQVTHLQLIANDMKGK